MSLNLIVEEEDYRIPLIKFDLKGRFLVYRIEKTFGLY